MTCTNMKLIPVCGKWWFFLFTTLSLLFVVDKRMGDLVRVEQDVVTCSQERSCALMSVIFFSPFMNRESYNQGCE